MSDTTGTFRIDIEIENPGRPGSRRVVENALVDTAADCRGFQARFSSPSESSAMRYGDFGRRTAQSSNGGPAPLSCSSPGKRAADDVAFGEPGDLVLLGARSLEGLNLRVEPALKRLVDADPAPTAASH